MDYKKVNENPLAYHVNAHIASLADSKLGGKDSNVILNEISIMGLLGSFVRAFYKNSTLLKSPIFSSDGGSGDRIDSLEGYDPKFDGICKAVQRAITDAEVKVDITGNLELSETDYVSLVNDLKELL